ncbi:hypothetical protein EGM51_14360 [Verrucomicrobia bacterium S94]|nr:hypothetical protein EGM51_14360 [Verrucomicrobia bacterium S94]
MNRLRFVQIRMCVMPDGVRASFWRYGRKYRSRPFQNLPGCNGKPSSTLKRPGWKRNTNGYISYDTAYPGIDGKRLGYITVVRDIDSGTVFYIGKGKGGDPLKKFRKRIKIKPKQIKAVSIDMASSYNAWV